MNHRTLSCFMVAALGFSLSQAVASEIDPSAGKALSNETCVACHGQAGVSDVAEWPSLAGQQADYTEHQLKLFRNENRYDPDSLMTGEAAGLTDEDIQNLAAYYAEQEPGGGAEVDAALAERGRQIYLSGIRDDGVAACSACHGPRGNGVVGAQFPQVAGQHQPYMLATLKAYKQGERTSDRNQMMRDIAQRMSDEDLEAVSAYLSSLSGGR